MIKCSVCGAMSPKGSKYCKECGAELVTNDFDSLENSREKRFADKEVSQEEAPHWNWFTWSMERLILSRGLIFWPSLFVISYFSNVLLGRLLSMIIDGLLLMARSSHKHKLI